MSLLLLLPMLGCGLSTNDDGDDSDADTDADADSDTDTDADTDTDTDADADLTTYEAFVAAHAEAYCGSLEACTYLDDQGYENRVGCVTAITDFFNVACDSYQQVAAERCVREDRQIASACEESRNGQQPLQCRDVCTAPPE